MKSKYFYSVMVFSFVALAFAGAQNNQWQPINTGTKCYYRSIQFMDANTAVIVGNGGVITKTSNGGASWTSNGKKHGHTLSSVCHKGTSCFTSGDQGFLIRSANEGASWDTVHLNLPGFESILQSNSCQLSSVCFAHNSASLKGGIVGFIRNEETQIVTGMLLITSDGGNTWIQSTQNFPYALNYIEFLDDNNGIIVGENGSIYKTTDGGNSWTQKTSGTTQSIRSVDYGDANTVYAVGGNGGALVLKSTDGGDTWTAQSTNCKYYLSSVKFSTNNKGYAVGGMGTILSTTNGGNHWQEDNIGNVDLNAITIAPNGTKYAVGENGMIYYNTGNN